MAGLPFPVLAKLLTVRFIPYYSPSPCGRQSSRKWEEHGFFCYNGRAEQKERMNGMETILLGAVLGVLVLVLLLLWKLYGALAAREEVLRQQAREDADRLRDSLDQKVTLSMGVVSDRLGQVSRGLGSMQSLAQGVGDLKKVLTNVKNRGIWGEMQLGNLLADMLAPDQYGTNVAVRPRSQERVEFAIRLPGRTGEGPVWLPIDAKFPLEDYQRLVEAREAGDGDGETLALKQLELRLKSEARDIRDKYIAPPYSTDFGLLYLPLEGLFAEAVSLPGLVGELQRKYRVTLAGPTTLAALINSLQMGFRTLAVQKQTSQVWRLVAQINNDLGTFQLAVEKAEKKLEEAQNALETVGNRTRILKKHLEQAEKFTQALDNPDKSD
jgi:DNA recombination protein RmuC